MTQMREADVRKENIVETTHVSLGTSQTIDCPFVLNEEELVMTAIAFEKVDVEVPEVNPAKGSTSDVIAAVTFSVQCSGVVPGTGDQNDCLAMLVTIGDVMNDMIREFSKKEKENSDLDF